MNKDILNINNTLPAIKEVYAPLGLIGKTVGRYFEYKSQTAMLEYETNKIKSQTKIILKKIDTELQNSLDNNSKNFQKEMFRLEVIAKALECSTKDKRKIFKHIKSLTDMLRDVNVPLSIKEGIPLLIVEAHKSLSQENENRLQHLNLMQGFNPDTKRIKG